MLEVKWKIHFESVRISNDEMACKLPKGTVTVGIDGVQYMPIFCMTAGSESDCETYISKSEYVIKFNEDYKNEIKSNFPKAEAALIILEPDTFLRKLKDTISGSVKADVIHYYNYDINDINMLSFLIDVNSLEPGNIYSQPADNRYRHLLCKDQFFKEQREYRIILDSEEIHEPHKYDFEYESKYLLVDIDDLFSGIIVKI